MNSEESQREKSMNENLISTGDGKTISSSQEWGPSAIIKKVSYRDDIPEIPSLQKAISNIENNNHLSVTEKNQLAASYNKLRSKYEKKNRRSRMT